MKLWLKWIALLTAGVLITSLLIYGTAHAELRPIPAPSRVVDETATLSAPQRQELTERLLKLKETADVVLVVVIVDTTKPEDVFSYSQRLFDAWQIGAKGKDNWVLLLVAKADRRVRLHTGYGTEGPIPDARAKRITDAMAAKFKQGNFYGGISLGVDEVGRLMTAEKSAKPVEAQKEASKDWVSVWTLLFIGLLLSAWFIAWWVNFRRLKEEQAKEQRAELERRRRAEEVARWQIQKDAERREESRQRHLNIPLRGENTLITTAVTTAAVAAAAAVTDVERKRREDAKRREEEEARRRRDEEARRRRAEEDEERRRSSYSSSDYGSSSSSWSSSDSGGSSGGGGSDSSW